MLHFSFSVHRPAACLALVLVLSSLTQARGFLPPVNYPVGGNPYAAAVADFNGDGKLDLAVVNRSGNSISILFGTGDGTFVDAKTYPCRAAQEIVAADLNGDGKVDLVAACVTVRRDLDIVVFLNGASGFLPPQGYSAGFMPSCIAVADIDGDAIPDIIAAVGNAVSFLKGNGDGSFQSGQLFTAGGSIESLAVADLNKDGKLDLVAADVYFGMDVLLGNGDGTFASPIYFSDSSQPRSVAVGDFNRDGILDAVLADSVDTATVFLGNGDGTFQPGVIYTVGKVPRSVAVGDFNGDGALDAAVVVSGPGSVTVMYGRGDGTFPLLRQFLAGGPTGFSWFVAVADFNHDRALDLAVVNEAGASVSILMNSGGTFVTATSSENPAPAGQPVTFTATVVPSLISTIPTGSVQFADGTTILATVPLDQNGVASYTTSGLTTGTHTIRTKYSGDPNFNPNMGKAITQIIE